MAATDEPITVRPMKVNDLPDILEIERHSFPTPWSKGAFLSELLENDRAHYLVAQAQRRAVGYIGLWLIAGEGHVTNVAVHPSWRKKGIGRRLLEAMADFCLAHGARRMTLEVRRTNVTAQRLYEQLGFVYCGTRKGYYRDNGEDAFIMWRELDEPLVQEFTDRFEAAGGGRRRTPDQQETRSAGAAEHPNRSPAPRAASSIFPYLLGSRERPKL